MRLFFVFAVVAALLLYSSGLWAPYHLDDSNVLKQSRSFEWGTARPLGFASFWINGEVASLVGPMLPWTEPFYYRLVNVLIHAIAATSLFWLVWELTGAWLAPTLAATLFLVHPIQTQAVTYITQRFESQAAMFMFLTAAAYVRFRRTGLRRWLIAAFALGAGAVLTKETALVLPIWLLLIELVFFDGVKLKKQALYIAPFGVAAAYIVWRSIPVLSSATLTWISWDRYFITQGPVLAKYFELATWPRQQFLFYSFEPVSAFSWLLVLQWALVLGVVGLGIYCLKRSPLAAFGILSFFILLLPMIVLPLPDLINEHRLYPAFAGVAIATAALFQAINRRSVLAIAGLLVVLLGVKTFLRNSDWNDQITFLESHRQAFPHDSGILTRLASYYYAGGRVNKALELNLESRKYENETNPYYRRQGHLLTAINLSAIYMAKNNPKAAKLEAQRALAARPDEPLGLQALGYAQLALGEAEDARRTFEKLVSIDPRVDSLEALRVAAARSGDSAAAEKALQQEKVQQVKEEKAAAAQPATFKIPAEYKGYFVFCVTLAALTAVAFAVQTVWTAIRRLLLSRNSPS